MIDRNEYTNGETRIALTVRAVKEAQVLSKVAAIHRGFQKQISVLAAVRNSLIAVPDFRLKEFHPKTQPFSVFQVVSLFRILSHPGNLAPSPYRKYS